LRNLKPRAPRAYYVGGFGVGCGVPRVEVLRRVPVGTDLGLMTDSRSDQFELRVVSKQAHGFTRGEIFYRGANELYDSISYRRGPRLVSFGKTWFELLAIYEESRRAYDNEARRKEAMA
jgi:hypothetical protein